jgi:hypothetical protein
MRTFFIQFTFGSTYISTLTNIELSSVIFVLVNSSGPGEESIEIDAESQPFIRGQLRLVCNISAITVGQLNSIRSSFLLL